MRVKHGFSVKNDDDDVDDDDDDDHSVCDDYAGDGQLPWESNLQTRCGPGADQMETNQGWAQLGPTPCLVSTWSALGLHLVHLVCIHCLVCICHAHAVKMHSTWWSVFLWIQFAQCACHVMQAHESNSQIEFEVLSPHGHECSWENMRSALHMQTCATCAEQWLNAQAVHVCNTLCVDVCVCAPLCTCSAVVHFGLHAKCTVNSLCLCLGCKGVRFDSNSQACLWIVKCMFASNSCIVFFLKSVPVLNRLWTHSNTIYEMNGDIHAHCQTRACLRIGCIRRAWHATRFMYACHTKTNLWAKVPTTRRPGVVQAQLTL